jgi:anti-sigma regulatory factor (Ser/Thr protein kinase)
LQICSKRRVVRIGGRSRPRLGRSNRGSVAIADAELAVTEVVTNAVLHAGGDGVSISLWSEGSILDVLVSDGGPGFTPVLAPRDIDQIGGRGLSIVDTVAESWGSSICAPSSVWLRFAMPESLAATCT